jgi:hypothetical protein
MTEEIKEPETTFDILMRVLRGIQELRLTDTPMNDLAYVYLEGYTEALDKVMNVIRREL